jgi:hypothetical protein
MRRVRKIFSKRFTNIKKLIAMKNATEVLEMTRDYK